MNPLIWGLIGTIIGSIVGASASIITTIINARNSNRNQSNIEKYKRQEIFREFQRDNYLKLQEVFNDAYRLVTLLYLEDFENYKKNGEWQKELLNPENDVNFLIVFRNISIYLERIENNELREELKNLVKKMKSTSMTSSLSESEAILLDLAKNDFDKAIASLGKELRNNY
jgi:hypothetical protein